MIKGITLNVVPHPDGWVVYEGRTPDTIRFFQTQDEALSYVESKKLIHEASILIHSSEFTQADHHLTLHMMSLEAAALPQD
jgi:hypothetical protein